MSLLLLFSPGVSSGPAPEPTPSPAVAHETGMAGFGGRLRVDRARRKRRREDGEIAAVVAAFVRIIGGNGG